MSPIDYRRGFFFAPVKTKYKRLPYGTFSFEKDSRGRFTKKSDVRRSRSLGTSGSRSKSASKVGKRRYIKVRKQRFANRTRVVDDNDAHNGLRIHRSVIWVNPAKSGYKKLGTFEFLSQNGAYIKGEEGMQTPTTLMGVACQQMCVAATNTSLYNGFAAKLFDLDPYQKTTGSGILSAGVIPGSNRLMIKTVDMDIQLANGSTAAQALELVFLKFKNDSQIIADPFEYYWTNSLARKAYGQSAAVQPNDTTSGAGEGYLTASQFGLSPFYEAEFNKMFKVLKRKTFVVDPGQTVKEIVRLHVNRMIRRDIADEANGEGKYWTKGDIIVSLIVRGAPIAIVNDAQDQVDGVTTAAADIMWTSTQRYAVQSYGPLSNDMNRGYVTFPKNLTEDQVYKIVDTNDDVVGIEDVENN